MDNLYIELIQLNSNTYFWMLKDGKISIACSYKNETKSIIEKEVNELAIRFKLKVVVNER